MTNNVVKVRPKRLVGLIGGLVLLGVMAVGLTHLRQLVLEVHGSQQWPTTTGKVVTSEVRIADPKRETWQIHAEYGYEVDGVPFTASDPKLAHRSFGNKGRADRLVRDDYSLGDTVTVYYPPADPSQGILMPGMTATYTVLASIAALAMVMVGMAGLYAIVCALSRSVNAVPYRRCLWLHYSLLFLQRNLAKVVLVLGPVALLLALRPSLRPWMLAGVGGGVGLLFAFSFWIWALKPDHHMRPIAWGGWMHETCFRPRTRLVARIIGTLTFAALFAGTLWMTDRPGLSDLERLIILYIGVTMAGFGLYLCWLFKPTTHPVTTTCHNVFRPVGAILAAPLMLPMLLTAGPICKRRRERTRHHLRQESGLTDAQLFGLACDATMTEQWGGDHSSLRTGLDREYVLRDILKKGWNVESTDDLYRTVEWLFSEGHRYAFQSWFAAYDRDLVLGRTPNPLVTRYRKALDEPTFLAWDLARIVSLAKWGTDAELIDEETAWDWIMAAASELQACYPSWYELANEYKVGTLLWSENEEDKDLDIAHARVLLLTDSPCAWIDWNTPLDTENVDDIDDVDDLTPPEPAYA